MEERELTCCRCNSLFKHQSIKKRYCFDCCRQKKKELNQRHTKIKKVRISILEFYVFVNHRFLLLSKINF